MREERSQPTPVGELIDGVLAKIARVDVAPIVRLRRRWDEVAGEWAERCRPIAIRDGVLTVEVASGMDASLLRYATAGLVSAVAEALGDGLPVTRISIRVRRG